MDQLASEVDSVAVVDLMVRVLHIVESMGHGSVETWLLRMAAHARARDVPIDWEFYCTLEESGANEAAATELGIRVRRTPCPIGHKSAFARALRAELLAGRFDVLHAHHDLVSGVYLAAAAGLKIRRRIVHVHNADEAVLTEHPIKQALLRPGLRRVCLTLADQIVANSNYTLDAFLAGRGRRQGRDKVHYLGIDSRPFERSAGDRRRIRAEFGLAPDAPILLFAGRMTPEKNPVFAVDVLAAIRASRPDVVGLFVGAGSLESAVRARAAELGQSGAVTLAGWRADVPEIMAASDWFILPHPEDPPEGFGIAVVEAQLAGLRLLLSRGVLDDPLLPTAVYGRMALADGPLVWASAALDLLLQPAPSREAASAAHRASPMDMDGALADLLSLYG